MQQNNRTDTRNELNEQSGSIDEQIFGGFAYRKQLRYRVALLTGLVVMRDELNADIAEMTGQLNGLESGGNGGVNGSGSIKKRGRPRKVDQQVIVEGRAVGLLPAADAAPAAKPAKVAESPGWTAERREAMRQIAIARWSKAKALGHATRLPKKAVVGAVGAKTITKSAASIGFHTNTEFLYEFAAAHNGLLSISAAKAAASKSRLHKNLAVGGRMFVAIAEMMRKGFMAKEGGYRSGTWRLLPAAKEVYERERSANQDQSSNKK